MDRTQTKSGISQQTPEVGDIWKYTYTLSQHPFKDTKQICHLLIIQVNDIKRKDCLCLFLESGNTLDVSLIDTGPMTFTKVA